MIKKILKITLGTAFLFSACQKENWEKEINLTPDCNIENFELLAETTLSDEKGLIVETVSTDGKKRIRIRFKGNDSYLDPCNLPEGIAIGQSIRFSGTLYRINDTDHMNLDLFPFSFSKLEMID